MMANDPSEVTVTQRRDHFRSVLDVPAHHRGLLGIQPPWLEQNLRRGMQFADIVKQRGGSEPRDLAAIETHAASYPHHVPSDPSRVTVKERVFLLDRSGDLGQ